MSTSTQPTFNAKIMDLPIMKNLGENQIAKSVNNFRNGEKPLYNGLKLGAYGVVGFLAWTYALPILTPIVAGTLGLAFMLVQLAIAGVIMALLVMLYPAIAAWTRTAARWLHKSAIKYKPFEQLEREKQKLIANQVTFRVAKQNIKSIQNDMANSSERMKKDAETSNENIFRLDGKAKVLKAKMDEMVARLGVEAKTEDEYVGYASQLFKVVSESQRVINKEQQSKLFMDKYKSREIVMKKMSQKLEMVEIQMENKILDFDATVDFLKADYEFAQKSNAATYAAKSAIGFNSGWERDYALEVIAESIANDTAMTSGNLKDIESLTSNYNLDSDDLYANLELVANRLQVNDGITDFKQYNNPDYVLTEKDKRNAGGIADMF